MQPNSNATAPVIIVTMAGGLIQSVRASSPVRVIVLDSSVEGLDEDTLENINGKAVSVHDFDLVGYGGPGLDGIDPAFVANVVGQYDEPQTDTETSNGTISGSLSADEIPVGESGQLVTMDGRLIQGLSEVIPGTAMVYAATRASDGTLVLEMLGGTDVDWNGQATKVSPNGEQLFITEDGEEVAQSSLKLVRLQP